MERNVFGLVSNQEHANRVIDALLAEGFPIEAISILYPNQDSNQVERKDFKRGEEGFRRDEIEGENYPSKGKKGNLTTEKHTKAPEGAAIGGVTGGVIGGTLGLLAGIGALAIPGLGPFIAAGPLLAAMSGSALGGSLGLVVGSLVGLGIPEYVAKKYESGLKSGKTLICVETRNNEDVKRIENIFKNNNVQDVSTSLEKTRSY